MYDIGAKSIFSKILTAEDIALVIDPETDTPYADLENRKMGLPVWVNISEETENMCLVHESGHFTYTPIDYVREIEKMPEDEQKAFGHVLNVLEDVRIDQRQWDRLPGTFNYYLDSRKELVRRDFFKIKEEGRDVTKFNLIDKINVEWKTPGAYPLVFSDDEKAIFERVKNAYTFEQTRDLAHELYQQHKDQLQKSMQNGDIRLVPGKGGKGNMKMMVDANGNPVYADILTVEAWEKSFRDSTQEGKGSSKKYKQLSNITIRDKGYAKIKVTTYEKNKINNQTNRNKYFDLSRTHVDSMISVFNRLKSAMNFARTRINKLGVLDMKKLYSYKYNDDIFLRKQISPKQKNHGFVLLMDMSGSMSGSIFKQVTFQAFMMAYFCKRLNIPCEIYGFRSTYGTGKSANSSSFGGSYELIQFSHAGSSVSDLQTSLLKPVSDDYDLATGGTPLAPSLVGMVDIIGAFREKHPIDVLNFFVLSDGDCDCRAELNATVIDRKTNSMYVVKGKSYQGGVNFTNPLFRLIRDVHDARISVFFLHHFNELKDVKSSYLGGVSPEKIVKSTEKFVHVKDSFDADNVFYCNAQHCFNIGDNDQWNTIYTKKGSGANVKDSEIMKALTGSLSSEDRVIMQQIIAAMS